MKLPNGSGAIADLRKIRNYYLSTEHPRGRHKARVFKLILGVTAEDSEALADTLRQMAVDREAVAGVSDVFGDRYIIDFDWEHGGRSAAIRSCWIVLKNETAPRFVTCFVR